MSLNETPGADRISIGFFGMRNSGKSSLVNAITNQDMSLVSDVKGTTTDPVLKAMELLPIGPVTIIDTPGLDDEGKLGEMRVQRAKRFLQTVDMAVLVSSAEKGLSECDKELIKEFERYSLPYIIALNKCDIAKTSPKIANSIAVSALERTNITELKQMIAGLVKTERDKPILSDLIKSGDIVVLVTPIDESAPKGRLILPQVQAIRDILDAHAISMVVQVDELEAALASLSKKPAMVVCDSQVFAKTAEIVPKDILLTSFSILMARKKGLLTLAVNGVSAIDSLEDGDKILISEGCTHHRQCGDIGTVKLPNLLRKYTGKEILFDTSSGKGFPNELSQYKLIIHCGGCMLTEREVLYRMRCAEMSGVPITNYGTAIAYMRGILERSLEVFSDLQ